MSLLKVFEQTLKDKDGRFSRKSLTMFVSFATLIFLVLVDTITKAPALQACCRMPIDYTIVSLLAGIAMGQSGLTLYEKVKTKE